MDPNGGHPAAWQQLQALHVLLPMLIDDAFQISSSSSSSSSDSDAFSSSSAFSDHYPQPSSSSSDDDAFMQLQAVSAPARQRHHETATGWWEDVVSVTHTDLQFKRDFRLDRRSFCELNALLVPHWEPLRRAGRPPVVCDKALAMCLWRLANITVVRLVADQFNMSDGWTDKIIKRMMELILQVLANQVCMPHDATAWANLRERWKGQTEFKNVVAAIDGSHIPLEYRPRRHTRSYYNRKQFPSLLLQGLVSVDGFFLHTNVGCPGSYHDARVLRCSKRLLTRLSQTLPPNHYIHPTLLIPVCPG